MRGQGYNEKRAKNYLLPHQAKTNQTDDIQRIIYRWVLCKFVIVRCPTHVLCGYL